jgi:hypothetical protein
MSAERETLRRVLLTTLIFLGCVGVSLLPVVLARFRSIMKGEATGLAFVLGSPGENAVRVAWLLAMAALAWWISGKFEAGWPTPFLLPLIF